ncbi:MAG: hypothetical protein ACXVH1_31460 [Solirubrobacteraceae bacterium]
MVTTISLSGALLAAAFALSKNAADLRIHGAAHIVFSVAFLAAVALLVAAILVSVIAIQPSLRHRLNADLARYWARESVSADEARADAFKLDVALLDQLGAGNERRASRLLAGQYCVVGALLAAAAGAIAIFFA